MSPPSTKKQHPRNPEPHPTTDGTEVSRTDRASAPTVRTGARDGKGQKDQGSAAGARRGRRLARQVQRFIEQAFPETADNEEIAAVRAVVIQAGWVLEDLGCPGAWERLGSVGLFERLHVNDQREQVGMAIHLMGFLGWHCVHQEISPERCLCAMQGLVTAAPPSPILEDLLRTARQLFGPRPLN